MAQEASTDSAVSSDDGTTGESEAEQAVGGTPGPIVPDKISRLSADFRMGLVRPASLDPALAVPSEPGQMALANMLFDGLTQRVAGQAEPQPALAESFGVSADGLTWTFTLRPDVTFSDGRPITAADAEASIERIVHQGLANWSGLGLQSMVGYNSAAFGDDPTADVVGVRAVDERRLEISLRTPFAPLPALLAAPQFGIVPADGHAGLATGESPTSGSLAIAQTAKNGIVLKPVDRSSGGLGVAVEFFDDGEAAFEDYLAGILDWSAVPVNHWSSVPSTDRDESISNTAWFYVLNDDGPLADLAFRSAVAGAIDTESIVRAELAEAAEPLDALVLDGVAGYVNADCGAACAFDPAASSAALAELYPDGDIPTVHLDVLNDSTDLAVAAAIVANLDAVGVPAEVRAHDVDALADGVVSGELAMFRYGWVAGFTSPDAYLAPLAERTSIDASIGLEDHITPGALAKARSESDPTVRSANYRAIEQELLDAVVVVPFAQFRSRVAVSERVDGFVSLPDGTFDINEISLSD